jgi:hypothetical protein
MTILDTERDIGGIDEGARGYDSIEKQKIQD